MSASFIERELKFDVPDEFVVPVLDSAIPAGSSVTRSVQLLRSEYFDTARGALSAAHITFRRRSGTDDTGWHLKIPHGAHREELHAELSESMPEELKRLLLGVTRGEPLVAVATLETERHVTRVNDAHGSPVADIDLDKVSATVLSEGQVSLTSWTELELELGNPEVPDEQLELLAELVTAAGARPASTASKLQRALAASPSPTNAAAPRERADGERHTAGDRLLSYLEEQQRALLLGDLAIRRDDQDAIHKTRVATRRFRSTLRVFGSFVDEDRSARLDRELRWYAELLGAVRDSQVMRKRFDGAVADLPAELVVGPVQQRIDDHLDARRDRDWALLREEIEKPRYLGLLGDIASFAATPPLTPKADSPASALRRPVSKAERTVAKRLKSANRSGDVEQLHRARKSAKRARYAAEVLIPVVGRSAQREADLFEQLQDLLGEHQDSVVGAELLLHLGRDAERHPGESGFTFGVLYEREQGKAEAARHAARKTARKLA